MGENYKCDICGAPATVHLTQIVDGKVRKIHLCEKCATKNQIAELPILKFTEMLAKTLASGGKKNAETVAAGTDASREISREDAGKKCPVCGMSSQVFEKDHRLGCPHCYDVFSKEIDAILPEIQRGKKYVENGGHATPRSKKNLAESEELSVAEIRERLKNAVAQENFKLAATLRDQLRMLEKKPAPAKKSLAKKSVKSTGKTRARSAKKSSSGDKKS